MKCELSLLFQMQCCTVLNTGMTRPYFGGGERDLPLLQTCECIDKPIQSSSEVEVHFFWRRPAYHGTDLVRVCTYSITGNDMAIECNTLPEKLTLFWVEFEVSFLQMC